VETLEIKIEARVIRKLRALSALEGFTSPSQIEARASDLFESALDNAIRAHVDEPEKSYASRLGVEYPEMNNRRVAAEKKHIPTGEEVFDGLSDGLGDDHDYDSEEPEPETDAFAMVPKIGGLSDKEIEHDMDVEDPEHEAAAVPPLQPGPNDNAEDLFLALAGIPLQMDGDDEIDHRILKRKRQLKTKAKVTGLLEDAQIRDAF
jgi:hypothetical protein